MSKKKKVSKKVLKEKLKEKVEVLIPSTPSVEKVPDFTERAVNTSNSKRIRFLKAIEKLIPSVNSKEKTYSIEKLLGENGIASSLPPKIAKRLDLAGKGIILKGTKFERVEDRKNPLITEVSLVKK